MHIDPKTLGWKEVEFINPGRTGADPFSDLNNAGARPSHDDDSLGDENGDAPEDREQPESGSNDLPAIEIKDGELPAWQTRAKKS